MRNIDILKDTLSILNHNYSIINNRYVKTKLNREQMENINVYLPEDIDTLCNSKDFEHIHVSGEVGVSCQNMDSFTLARKEYQDYSYLFDEHVKPVLVLNLANPVHPGGGVRRGANAQEEDLCRKSSLLLSLESQMASKYYQYNKALHTNMGSDAIMITPEVEIIKDEKGNLLDEHVIVSVMTCAAPMVTYGYEGRSEGEYQKLVYNRIMGMLKVAAYLGYKVLVLGAFGCGAFDNDAHIVSDLFYKALKEFDYDGMKANDFFRRIDFAVFDKTRSKYNYNEFSRNFNNFYRDEIESDKQKYYENLKNTESDLDNIRGSLFGGAIGDALGYEIEFDQEKEIFDTYGKNGITSYALHNDKALISDDTQMSLFTANGILNAVTRAELKGIAGDPVPHVCIAYQDWLKTQETKYKKDECKNTWLMDLEELYDRRAPGITCLQSLKTRKNDEMKTHYIDDPINHSKGCGGIMRVAPLALHYHCSGDDQKRLLSLDKTAGEIAAITHSHSLGYMPASMLNHILCMILVNKEMNLKDIVNDAIKAMKELYADDCYLDDLTSIVELAIELSENNDTDLNNIHKLGEGWVAEETLAIAIYCSLKYHHDFSKAVITAVNHNGDSDSTGAVTGNIVGAFIGYDAIDEKWKQKLELSDIILEMADDLCHSCQISPYSHYQDDRWIHKYVYHEYVK